MDARITKGVALFALVVPLVALTQFPAHADAAGDRPTYTTYSVGSVDVVDADDNEHVAYCNGPTNELRDSAVGVEENFFPSVPDDAGDRIFHLGRAIGFESSSTFILLCHDDHHPGLDFD